MAIPAKINAQEIIERINLETLARRVYEISRRIGDEKERLGGVLAVAVFCKNDPSINNYAAVTVGRPGDNLYMNLFYVNEKISRTRGRRLEGHNEVASSQSADADKKFYGGCIVAFIEGFGEVEIYFSYSGAKQEVDEAVSAILAHMSDCTIDKFFESNPVMQIAGPLLADVGEFWNY